jgi:hypothetical protein
MKLHEDHWLVRWAFLFSPARHEAHPFEWPPHRISLCWLFWRGVFCTLLPTVTAGGFISALIFLTITDLSGVLFAISAFVASLAFVVIITNLPNIVRNIDNASLLESVRNNVVVEYAKAVKSRVCPLVEITSERE